MDKPYICNARINSATIDIERGFIITGWVYLEFGAGAQGFGGYVIGGIGDARAAEHDKQPNLAAIWLAGVMQAAGVEHFSDMKGKIVRIRKVDEFGKIEAIGHAIKDEWFAPEQVFADAMLAERERT